MDSVDSSKGKELIKTIEELRETQLKMELQIKELSLLEENAVKVSEKFRILGDSTTEMLEFKELESIYNFITESLQKQLPETVILFNSIDEENGTVKLESITGIENKFLKQILKVSGINPIGKEFKLIHSHDDYFRSGRFVEFQGSLALFSASDLSPVIAQSIEKLIGLHKIYTIGIKKDTILMAAIHFFTFNKKVIYDSSFIEAFVKQAGVVIQNKIAEKSLKESEEKYRNIFENSTIGIYRTTPQGRVLLANPSLVQMLGFDNVEELKQRDLENDFYEPQYSRSDFRNEIEANGEIKGNESAWLRKDGTFVYVRESAKVIRDKNGLPLYYEGTVEDITRSKLAEIKLIESKETYFDVFNSVVEAIFIQDPETLHFIDVNKGVEKMYGFSREEMIGKSPALLGAEGYNNLEQIRSMSQQVFITGIPARFDFWAVRKNGEIFPKEIIVNKGKYFGKDILIATARDISENIQVQEQLKLQTRFRQLLIEISASYINLPLEAVEASINNSLAVMGKFVGADHAYIFEYDNQTNRCSLTNEWCNEGIASQFQALQNLTLPQEWVANFRKGEVVYISDIVSHTDDYAKRVLELKGVKSLLSVPMLNQGIFIGFISFDSVNERHDYTDTDKQLLTVSAQLLVNIKLRIKSEEQIIQAKEKAEENDRLKSAFLANMSHEIRTPLNSIIGFAELVGDPDFSIAQHGEFAQLISDNGNNLLSIISNIMDISKIEAGQAQIKISTFSISDLVNSVFKDFSFKAQQKGIDLKLNTSDPLVNIQVKSDETKVRQIITNLLGNAFKFTQQGFIEIGVTAENDEIQISIKDTGIGIPAIYHDKIFERFRQVETADTRRYGGNGLGLAISKSLVELLGGKIWMESAPGKGSTFSFTIPLVKKIPEI